MAEIMMQLGSFQFGLETAAYQEFQRTTAYTWAAQGRFGQDDALQSTGPGADTITLPGVIYPHFRGGIGQLDAMRSLAGRMEPQTLVDGRGRMLGEWVIEQVDERGTVFAPGGVALRQEFTLKMRRFPAESGAGLLGAVADVVVQQTFPITADLGVSSLSLATSTSNASGSVIQSLNDATTSVSGVAAQLGTQASSVLGAINSGINAARTLQNAGNDAGRLLASMRTVTNIPSALNGLVQVSGNVSRAAGVASSILKRAGVDLTAGGVDPAAIAVVRDSMISVNRLTVLAAAVRNTADSIIAKT